MASKKELLNRFDQMESERQTLLAELNGHSPEVLCKKPSSGAWSVTEVIMHLTMAEEGSLKYLQKKLE